MVAKTTPLPNIRKLFVPDPGYMIADCDLAQADAQVVAWEADDEELKAVFRDPTADLHDENAKTIFGTLTPANRQLAKAGVHLTNYGGKARTCATALGITVKQAEDFQRKWFQATLEYSNGTGEWRLNFRPNVGYETNLVISEFTSTESNLYFLRLSLGFRNQRLLLSLIEVLLTWTTTYILFSP